MTAVVTLLRAIRYRAATSAVIGLVALCACAAAAVGPTYYSAAKQSILQDTFASSNVVGHGVEAIQQGPVVGQVGRLQAQVDGALTRLLGPRTPLRHAFGPPVAALEARAFFPRLVENVPLVWRSGVCAHLHVVRGACATAPDTVVVSESLARTNHWGVGDVVRPAGRTPPLRIVGVYTPVRLDTDYWFSRGDVYFPAEVPSAQASPYDALFTPRATIERLRGHPQGTVVIARTTRTAALTTDDVDALGRVGDRLPAVQQLVAAQVAVVSLLGVTAHQIHASWGALAVPVVVVTAELLVLIWLLLFLVVTDAVEARGGEIALAKLRGYAGRRVLAFGLGEPVALLAVACPVGAVLGWLLTRLLATVLLRAGTPVDLPGLAWAAAVLAAAGGIAAVAVAARTTLVRPVVEQWRRTTRRGADRGWVFDAVVLTGAVAGLVQLAATGRISSTRHSSLAMLVPGLLGLAVAVVASRLLPVLCRAAFGRTRRRGGLGGFLAVRHIARRPGGTRTTMILATAVALATFSVAVWSVGRADRTRVADVTVGAPTVLTVVPADGVDLGRAVERADPTGRAAAAVAAFDDGTHLVLAVQPARFAHVAHWSAAGVHDAAALLSPLAPPAPAPLVLSGGAVHLTVRVARLSTPGARLVLDVVSHGGSAPTPVDLGPLPAAGRTVTLSGQPAGCPCVVQDLAVQPAGTTDVDGALEVRALVDGSGAHRRVLTAATDAARWTDSTDQDVTLTTAAGALDWRFFAPKGTPPVLRVHDRPEPLPALVSTHVAGPGAALTTSGLDGADLGVRVATATRTVPGAPARGIVVDYDYAVRAAFGSIAASTTQVWVRGPVDRIGRRLLAEGVQTVDVASSTRLDHELGRQGPGLASVLFLADAGAAAVLAALAAVLSLSAAARRRRYEYAALLAAGAPRRTLYVALAAEQVTVVAFGTLVGIAAGLVATGVAGGTVPEFIVAPARDLLVRTPSAPVMLAVLGGSLVVLLGAAAAAAAALLRSVTPDQLREAGT